MEEGLLKEAILSRKLDFEIPRSIYVLAVDVKASIDRYKGYRKIVTDAIRSFGIAWGEKFSAGSIAHVVNRSDIEANKKRSLNSSDYDVEVQCNRLVEYLEQRTVAEKVPNIFDQLQHVVNLGRIQIRRDGFSCQLAPQLAEFLQRILKQSGWYDA